MKRPSNLAFLLALLVATCLSGLAPNASAQTLAYSQDFDTDTTADWIVNMVGNSNRVDFFFDYSKVGIPAAPHSSGASTRGMILQANMATSSPGVFPAGVSVSPVSFSITENFDMHFDMWINFNGPFPGGGSGSTLVGGAGYGTAGVGAQVAGGPVDSVFIGATGDGGSSADYRVYAPAHSASYQDTDHVIGGDTTSPLLYAAGGRNSSLTYYATNFPGVVGPAAQTALYPNQNGTTANGSVGMKWRDVSLKKVGNTITYRIDGVLIATVDSNDAGTLGGGNIVFAAFDINATHSTDPNSPFVAFTLIDNVRITNFPNIVTVAASQPAASEQGATPGTFTISRAATGTSQTISYTLSGTASNGVDYVTLPGTVTFSPSASDVDVVVTPIDDSISEAGETVILTINEGPGYVGSGSATVTIADNDAQTLSISPISTSIYEGSQYDRAKFRITRTGDLNPADPVVLNASSIVSSGTAVLGTDFKLVGLPVQIDGGVVSVDVDLVAPLDNKLAQGNKTIKLGLKSGTGFAATSDTASVTLVDDDVPTPENTTFTDSLSGNSSSKWKFTFAANNEIDDYAINWGYDLATDLIPNAPNGASTALKLAVNKSEGSDSGAAGLNLYPLNVTLGKDFAVRFSMYLTTSSGGTTEYALMGINHSGSSTNWLVQSGSGTLASTGSDGYWFAVCGDGSGSAPGDYVLFRGNGPASLPTQIASASAASLVNVFKSPPFAFEGALDNTIGTETPTWADVEIRREGDIVSLRINNTLIISATGASAYSGGTIMLGYMDPYASIGADGAVYYSNLRIIDLTPVAPSITGIANAGGVNQIDFTGDASASAASFKLQSASVVNGPYADDGSATITQTGTGTFRATISATGAAQFYRIKR